METVLTVTAILMAFLLIGESHRIEKRSPTFVYEPPSQVEFSNSTGTVIPCSVRGTPTPMVRWEIGGGTPAKDIRGLRHARPDGSLVFSPFPAAEYKQDVHSAVYRCVASNTVGSITSRDIHIRGIVNQHYTIEVYDKFVNAGSTAVLYCHIPEHVKDFVTVTSWTEKPTGTVIQPSSVMGASGRYVMFPTGELHVRSVDTSYSYREYSCQARHRLVGEVLTSATSGRLIVREPHNKAPPQITDSKSHLIAREGELVALPCVAQGYPVPIYYWLKEETDGAYPVSTGQRITQLDGSLVIHQPKDDDSGTYICIANNSLGQDRISTELHVYAPLSASITPTRQLVHLGRPVSINCTLLGYPIHSVTWKKDSTLITTSSGRIMTNWNRLQIYSVLREDAGVYQCFVYNNMESAQTATELTLGDDTPEFQDTFREMKLHPGSLISLKCMATGSPLPQITWQLDGVPLPESHRIRLGDYVTPDGAVVSYVNISNSRIEDGGEYECTANNGVGSISYSSRVNILGPPVVRQMRNITVVAGEVLVMKCPVGGYPLEAVQWERAGVRLPYNHRQKVHKNGTLEVHHVERATDEGPYTCVARNKEGQSADSTAFVKVQVKPFIEPFTFPRTLKEQQRSSVVCTVSSGDLPIKIRWFKDDQPITENHGILIKEVVEYTSHLLFESIRLRHRGNYTCIASNEAGTVSHTATMVIHVPPRWIIEPSDSSVIKGRGIVVDCQAEGFPEPRIRWAKSDEKESPLNFKPVVSSPHLQVFENGSLSIHNARESDVGSYLCQATNGIGQGLSKVIKLHVKIAANFDTKFMAEMVEKGHNVKLKCHARGDQPIMVIWLKEKQNINLQEDPRYKLLEPVMSSGVTSELLIRQADRRDSALFTCIASNAYGQDDTNIQLIVQEPPDSPQNLQVSDRSSRTLTLRWSASYSGNSIVTEYLVQYKHKSEKWQKETSNVTISGTETDAIISGLKPASVYNLRVLAKNGLGISDPSTDVEAKTEEEAPEGPPMKVRGEATSSKSLKITWKPPNQKLQHGILLGYYVGYKKASSSDGYVYKSLEIQPGFKEECHLSGLSRFTKYNIIVQAHNSKGSGPPSEELLLQTLESDPPITPQLRVATSTSSSITLTWNPVAPDGNPITGFTLSLIKNNGQMEEVNISGDQNTYTFSDLSCGSQYQVFLVAFNSAGKGEPCDTVHTKTLGGAPVAPSNSLAMSYNVTSVTVNLESWEDGGCPLLSYQVRYRRQDAQHWKLIATELPANKKKFLDIHGLARGMWYRLQVTGRNIAGKTEAEYVFRTLVTPEAPYNIKPNTALSRSSTPFYLDLNIMIPVAVSVFVIIIVLIVLCLVIRKKTSNSSHTGSYVYGVAKGPAHATLRMTDYEKKSGKKKKKKKKANGVYYPTPYATTQLTGEDLEKSRTEEFPQPQEEPLYATVKRTPRPPRSDAHIYQSPVPSLSEMDQLTPSPSPTTCKRSGMTVKLSTTSDPKYSGSKRRSSETKTCRHSEI